MADPEELVQAWIRAYNERDAEAMQALMAPDYHHERPSVAIDGADSYVAYTKKEWDNRPDARFAVNAVTASGGRVVLQGTWSVTSTKPVTLVTGLSLPVTGKKAVLPFAAVFETRNGLLASDTMYFDGLSFLTQLGYQVTIA